MKHALERYRRTPQLAQAGDANRAARVDDLRVPLGNRLEALQGGRAGQYGIRINDQWRLCFVWHNGHASDVEIVDYH